MKIDKYKKINVILGKNIRYHRKKKGLTQKELASDMNLSFQQIQKYENGTNNLSFAKLLELCDILKIKAVDLIANITETISITSSDNYEIKENEQNFYDDSSTQDRYTTVIMHHLGKIHDKKTRELIANMVRKIAEGYHPEEN